MEKTAHTYRDGDTRRGQIARAARGLIAEKGIAGLRTRAVAERAGINVSTLHFHVKGKAGLLELITKETINAFQARLPVLDLATGDALDMLRQEIASYRDSLEHHADEAQAFFEISNAAGQDPVIAALIEDFTTDWRERFVAILTKGRNDGVFRATLDPLPAALMVTSSLVAFARVAPEGLQMFGWVGEEIERSVLA